MKNRLLVIPILSLFLLSSCRLKKDEGKLSTVPTPTSAPKLLTLETNQKPYLSLTPRADGHELKLKIANINPVFKKIEYELLYTAKDNNLEIEKGIGDMVNIQGGSFERDLLLGTSSCTNGCKYKYDDNVNGGTLTLKFFGDNGETFFYESLYVLKTSAGIKKEKGLSLDNFSISAVPSNSEYFILLKNIRNLEGTSQNVFSVFSNGSGLAKNITSQPSSQKNGSPTSLAGDYQLN